MSFFKGIGFKNFKVFDTDTYFEFSPITILTGTNNSGKSSLLNGIKLLQDNFNYLGNDDISSDSINLEAIMQAVIDSNSLLERYGSLQQFITKGSKDNEFGFSFKRKMISIEDDIDIKFKIKVKDNNIKNGRISKITMTSSYTGESIVEIADISENAGPKPKNKEQYRIKLNFIYFTEKTYFKINKSIKYYNDLNAIYIKLAQLNEQLISYEAVENLLIQFNLEFGTIFEVRYFEDQGYSIFEDPSASHNPAFLIKLPTLNLMISEINNLQEHYDFSFIWKEKSENKRVFENEILSFYNTSLKDSYSKLNTDITKFLSDMDWIYPSSSYDFDSGINFIVNKSDHSIGIGFKKFTELYTNCSMGPNVIRSFGKRKDFKIQENLIKPAIDKNEIFYKEVFKPLLQMIASESKINKEREDKDNFIYNDFSPFDRMSTTNIEAGISELIFEGFNLIKSQLIGLNNVDFLSIKRINNRRTYSFGESDDFTSLVRKFERMSTELQNKASEFIDRWLKEFDIADGFIIKHDPETGSFKPFLKIGKHETLMADFGIGTFQLLPLLLKIIPESNPERLFPDDPAFISKIVVFEEPEANLHPALQSKLADLFVEANSKFNIQIIIESHSEYLIRKLQYLTGKGDLDPAVTQLYYFNHPDRIPDGETQIKKINIQKDGSLTDCFGKGFFDEATSWKFELLKINNLQKN